MQTKTFKITYMNDNADMFVFDENDNILITSMEHFKKVPKFPKRWYDPRFSKEDMIDFASYCSTDKKIENMPALGQMWVPRTHKRNRADFKTATSEDMFINWLSANNRWEPLNEIRPDAITVEVRYFSELEDPEKRLDIRGQILTDEEQIIKIVKLHF